MGRKMRAEDGTATHVGTIDIKSHPRTSTRCRATHDVPYTLRCVLDASHMWSPVVRDALGLVGAFQMHEDKDGRRWEVEAE